MIKLNIENILKEKKKSKYWLCLKMNITYKNLNQIIRGETRSISFKYLEEFCSILECNPDDLIVIVNDVNMGEEVKCKI